MNRIDPLEIYAQIIEENARKQAPRAVGSAIMRSFADGERVVARSTDLLRGWKTPDDIIYNRQRCIDLGQVSLAFYPRDVDQSIEIDRLSDEEVIETLNPAAYTFENGAFLQRDGRSIDGRSVVLLRDLEDPLVYLRMHAIPNPNHPKQKTLALVKDYVAPSSSNGRAEPGRPTQSVAARVVGSRAR